MSSGPADTPDTIAAAPQLAASAVVLGRGASR